jgi:chromosome segregation ATPase
MIFAYNVQQSFADDDVLKALDDLKTRVVVLESENNQLKIDLRQQNVSLRNDIAGKYTDLDRKRIKLQGDMKKLKSEDLSRINDRLELLEDAVKKNPNLEDVARLEAALNDSRKELKSLGTNTSIKNIELENKIDRDLNEVKNSLNTANVSLQDATRNQNRKLDQQQKSLQSLQNSVNALNNKSKMGESISLQSSVLVCNFYTLIYILSVPNKFLI